MRNKINTILGCTAVVALLTTVGTGCNGQSEQGPGASTPSATLTSSTREDALNIDTSKYVLAEEPDGAIGVITARAESKDGDEVVLLGRIGGSKKPWIEGRSAFMVIDASKQVVSSGQESGGTELCLEDCCASLRADCTTLVKLVDESGHVLPVDSRKILNAGVDDLVVIHGHIQRDEQAGTFVVIADGVHVRR